MEFSTNFEVLTDFMFNLERGFFVYKNGKIQEKPWKPLCFYKTGIIYPNSGIFICTNPNHKDFIINILADKDNEFYSAYPQDFLFRYNVQRSPVCYKIQLVPTNSVKKNRKIEMGTRTFTRKTYDFQKQNNFIWKEKGKYEEQTFCSILIMEKKTIIMNRDSFYDFFKEVPLITIGSVISNFVNLIELKHKRFSLVQKELINYDVTPRENYSNIIRILKLKFPNEIVEKCFRCKIPLFTEYVISMANSNKYCISCNRYGFRYSTSKNINYKTLCEKSTIKKVLVNPDERDFVAGVLEYISRYKKKYDLSFDKNTDFEVCNTTYNMFSGKNIGDRVSVINTVLFATSLIGIFNAPECPFTRKVKKILAQKTFIM